MTQANVYKYNRLAKVTLDSAMAVIKPAISNRKSNAQTTVPHAMDGLDNNN